MSRQGSRPRSFFKWIDHCPRQPTARGLLFDLKFGSRACCPARLRIRSALLSQCRLVSPEALAPRTNLATSAGSRHAELADWLADKIAPLPFCSMCERRAEWKVSHLPGARRVDPRRIGEDAAGESGERRPDRHLLRGRLSFRCGGAIGCGPPVTLQVQNLEGSIFQWANEHRPLHTRRQTSHADSSLQRVLGATPPPDVRAPLPPND